METTISEHERICNRCENLVFCKYRDEMIKAEDTINEFKENTKDFPPCLSVNLTCRYKRYYNSKTPTNLETDYVPRRSDLETGNVPQCYPYDILTYCNNENCAR